MASWNACSHPDQNCHWFPIGRRCGPRARCGYSFSPWGDSTIFLERARTELDDEFLHPPQINRSPRLVIRKICILPNNFAVFIFDNIGEAGFGAGSSEVNLFDGAPRNGRIILIEWRWRGGDVPDFVVDDLRGASV